MTSALFRPFRRKPRRGVLTLEWILLVTVIVLGIIGGLGAVRNATVAELQDLADAISAINIGPCQNCGP
jgi:Flp pilus assembly pilin Flp